MRETTLILDNGLYETIQGYSSGTGFEFNEVIAQALHYWFHDVLPEIRVMAELDINETEWRELWGMDANEVVQSLLAEPIAGETVSHEEEVNKTRTQGVVA